MQLRYNPRTITPNAAHERTKQKESQKKQKESRATMKEKKLNETTQQQQKK